MDLKSNSLTGGLPSNLVELSNVDNIQLSYNYFTGTIPDTYANFSNLTLNIASNKIGSVLKSSLCGRDLVLDITGT
jgi:hypothetical protein